VKRAQYQTFCIGFSRKPTLITPTILVNTYLLFYLQRLQSGFERTNYFKNSSVV